jgi:hypothetical protein
VSIYAQVSCSLPDKVAIIEAGDIAELVYYRSILRCRDNLTDGIIDRRLIDRWFAGIRGKPATHLNRLRDVGMLLDHPDGWCIPEEVWCKWNPTKAQVEAHRAAETERKRRWKEQRDSVGNVDAATDARQRRAERRDRQPEPEPEPETETEKEPSFRPSTDPREPAEPVDKFDFVVGKLVNTIELRSQPRNVGAWRTKVRTSIIEEHSDRIRDYMTRYPDAPYDVIAAAVEGDTHSLGHYETRGTGS